MLARVAQVFSFLGAVSSVPFISSFTKENIATKTKFTAGGAQLVLPKGEESSEDNVMAEAAKQIIESNGKEGVQEEEKIVCFWVTQFKTELFFCFNKASHYTPYLFHYSWATSDRSKKPAERLRWVDSITSYIKMTFKNNGGTGEMSSWLKTHMAWTRKWTSKFKPSEHCQIALSVGKYTLTCTPKENNPSETSAFTKTVSESELVIPEINLKDKN